MPRLSSASSGFFEEPETPLRPNPTPHSGGARGNSAKAAAGSASTNADLFFGVRNVAGSTREMRRSLRGQEAEDCLSALKSHQHRRELEADWSGRKRQRFGSLGEVDSQTGTLEQEIRRLYRELEEQRLASSRKEARLESELRNEKFKNEQKDAKIKRLIREEQHTKEQREQTNLELMRCKHEYDERFHRMDKENRDLENQCAEEVQILREHVNQLEHQLQETQVTADELRIELAQEKSIAASLRQQLASCPGAASFDDGQLSSLQNQTRRLERDKVDLQEQLKAASLGVACAGRASELEREVSQLRLSERRLQKVIADKDEKLSASREALERVQVLEKRNHAVTLQRDALLAVEAERDALLAERREWGTVFRKIVEEDSGYKEISNFNPLQALCVLQKYKDTITEQAHKCGGLELRASKYRVEAEKAQNALREAGCRESSLKDKLELLEEQKKQVTQQNEYLNKHCESLLRAIDQVRSEPYATLPKKDQDPVARISATHDNLVRELQASLTAANEKISELAERDKERLNSGMSPAVLKSKTSKIRELQGEVTSLEKERAKLSSRLDKALDRIAELEHHVAGGAYNPSKTRILHLKMNPEATTMAKAESEQVDALKKEVSRLQKLVSADAGSPPTSSSSAGEDANKRYDRLKQVFKENIKAFKEAVYLLTGLEITMKAGEKHTLTLRSMYAESAGDQLVFEWNAHEGKPRLVPTPFSKSLDENTLAYYTTCHSIPAFLSTLTLDLFGKQTLAFG